MSTGPTPEPSSLRSRLLGDGFQVLLFLGAVAIVGIAVFLRLTSAERNTPLSTTPATPTARSTPTSAAGVAVRTSQRTDFVGDIAFRCDRGTGTGLCVLDVEGGDVEILDDLSIYESAQAREPFSPTGNRMAFARRVDESQDIFVRHVHAGWVDQLVFTSTAESQPAWSPDGQYLAYSVEEAQGSSVWLYDFERETSRQLTASGEWNDKHPTWSPDGRMLAFWSDRDGKVQLYTVNVDTDEVQPLDTDRIAAWDPVWIKPPIQQRPPDTAETTLGLGIIFDSTRCEVEISAGDSGGMPTVSEVVLRDDDTVVFRATDLQTALYRTVVRLERQAPSRTLVLQAWQENGSASTPVEKQRTVTCSQPMRGTPTSEQPSAALPTPTPTFVVIEPEPEPADVFAAATMIVRVTEQARLVGTATPLPPNVVTATPTPQPLVVTSTPTPANQATQVARNLLMTAIAVTTGTPTPPSIPMITATSTPATTPTPTVTQTPIMVPVGDLGSTPTPMAVSPTPEPVFPQALVGKILFLSDAHGSIAAYAMSPDGSDIARLTNVWPYTYAAERDAYSPDRRYHVFVRAPDTGGASLQLFYRDSVFDVVEQLTFVGNGSAWGAAWSPTDEDVVFVSNQEGNDEIYVMRKDEWPATRLTNNTWPWDHHPSWSPDGEQIVFSSNRTGEQQIWIMNADGTDQRRIGPDGFAAWDPVWVKYAE